jgi:glycosyltransferase involved in cell wall biosynthesis
VEICLLRHYPLVEGPSMRSFADQLVGGLRSRGHRVYEFTAPVVMARLAGGQRGLRKWLGYFDQFVLFPPLLLLRRRRFPSRCLCVFADQALGPWIPLLKHRPHVIHVHDLLALEGALGEQPFHPVRFSGRLYQRWIRRGFRQGRYFVSVSAASRKALARHLPAAPIVSEVLYNPLPPRFAPLAPAVASAELKTSFPDVCNRPYLFHIGRNWYKNRLGVLMIWQQLHQLGGDVDLVMVGQLEPSLVAWIAQRPSLQPHLHVLDRASDHLIVALYNRAAALLFPSHCEGFGWPVLEAMACGCPVISTDRAPMSEVAGEAATLLPPCPVETADQEIWAHQGALRVLEVLQRPPTERQHAREQGLLQARRFHYSVWLDQLEVHYQRALAMQEHHCRSTSH